MEHSAKPRAKAAGAWRFLGGKADPAAPSVKDLGTGGGGEGRGTRLPGLGGRAQPGALCPHSKELHLYWPRGGRSQHGAGHTGETGHAGASSGTAAHNHSNSIPHRIAIGTAARGPPRAARAPTSGWRGRGVRPTPSTYSARPAAPGGPRLYSAGWGSDFTKTINSPTAPGAFPGAGPGRGGVSPGLRSGRQVGARSPGGGPAGPRASPGTRPCHSHDAQPPGTASGARPPLPPPPPVGPGRGRPGVAPPRAPRPPRVPRRRGGGGERGAGGGGPSPLRAGPRGGRRDPAAPARPPRAAPPPGRGVGGGLTPGAGAAARGRAAGPR